MKRTQSNVSVDSNLLSIWAFRREFASSAQTAETLNIWTVNQSLTGLHYDVIEALLFTVLENKNVES